MLIILRENPHLDYGYAVTSHSSKGQTADRVLVNVDTAQAGERLVTRRLAYVAVSRGRYDAQIYTNDKTQLAEGLGRDVSYRTATEALRESVAPTKRLASVLDSTTVRLRSFFYAREGRLLSPPIAAGHNQLKSLANLENAGHEFFCQFCQFPDR